DPARLEPRDGRGRAVRPAAAHARRPDPRRRGARRAQVADRQPGRRDGVPAPGRRLPRAGGVMSLRLTRATAGRVLAQLRHHRPPVAMMLFVPVLLLSLLGWIYDGSDTFDRIGPPLLGIFPFIVMFLVTSVATLRERTSGTLERLLTMPLGKGD